MKVRKIFAPTPIAWLVTQLWWGTVRVEPTRLDEDVEFGSPPDGNHYAGEEYCWVELQFSLGQAENGVVCL